MEHLTVAVWIFPFEISDVALGNGHVYGNIFYDKSGTSDDNVEFGLGSGEGLYWYINSGQKKMGPFNGADVDTTVSVPNLGLKPDTWYHVAGTFDDEKLEVYVDGELVGEKATPNNAPVMVWNDNNIEIGGRPDTNGGANLYKGLLDELVVYDRALTAEEIEIYIPDFSPTWIRGYRTRQWDLLPILATLCRVRRSPPFPPLVPSRCALFLL